ncbi:MAG: hypothetical protein ACTJGR_07420 [Pauljensenia sp.]
MSPWSLLREALRSAWAQKIPSALIVLVTAAMSVSALTTVGQAAARDRDIREQLDLAGARALTITDSLGHGLITPALLALVRDTSGVEQAVALSTPLDVSNGAIPGSQKVPAWEVSDPALVTHLTRGRAPQAGEGITSATVMDTLRLGTPAGWVQSDQILQYPLVAEGTTAPGFEDLDAGVIIQAGPDTDYRQLRVIIDDIAHVPATQRAVLAMIGTSDPTQIQVDSPQGIAMTSQLLTGQIAAGNRATLLLILGAGAFFVAIVSLTDVLLHRKDLGRRRALGITRGALTTLTTLRTTGPALLGAVLGGTGALIWSTTRGVAPPADFTAAVTILTTLVALVATIPPAAWAAHRDPVTVLRTP